MQMTTRSRPRAALIGLLACALLAAGGASAQVVISQSYGGGGNSGATYTNDFIEIFNRSASTVSLDGWSVQYASSTGTSWQVTALSGSLAPGQYYLVLEAAGAGLGVAIAPQELVAADIASGRLLAPWGFTPTGGDWALCRRADNRDRRIDALAQWLQQQLG